MHAEAGRPSSPASPRTELLPWLRPEIRTSKAWGSERTAATKGAHVRYLTLVTDAEHVSSPLRSLHLTPDVITHIMSSLDSRCHHTKA